MTVEKPKAKQLLRPITTEANSAMNQSQFLAITCNSLEAREKSRVHGAIGFGFDSHWLKNWRESFKPITKRSNRNHVITFDSHLRTALVDGDVAFYITCDCHRAKLDRQCEESEAKCFLNQRTTKSNHDDAYRENNRKIQREIRHNSEKRILCFFLPCDKPSIRSVALGVQRQCENCNSTARRNAECTSETKLQGITFIIGRTQACNLENHCAIAPRCIASLI